MAEQWELPAPGRRDGPQGRQLTFIAFGPEPLAPSGPYTAFQDGGAYQWAGDTDGLDEQGGGAVPGPKDYTPSAFTLPYHSEPCGPTPWIVGGETKSRMRAQVSVSEYDHWEVPVEGYITERVIGRSVDEEPSCRAPESSLETSLLSVTTLPYPAQSGQQFSDQASVLGNAQVGWTHEHFEERFRQRAVPVAWSVYPNQPPSLVHEDSMESWTSMSTDQNLGEVAASIPTALLPHFIAAINEGTPASGKAFPEDELPAVPVASKPIGALSKKDATISKRPASFDECVTIFETTPGAMTKVKRRRKLNADSHKSFKVTRRIGACLECRFRKRTVSPGTTAEMIS